MHKKLEAELVSLAHSILQMKNKEDINALHKKAHTLYEKLSVLKFVDEYINTTPNATETKEELIDKIEDISGDVVKIDEESKIEVKKEVVKVIETVEKIEISSEKKMLSEEQMEEIFGNENNMLKNDIEDLPSLQTSLEDEFKDAISADVATQMFEKVTKENPVIQQEIPTKNKSLNDTLFKNNLQIGLNDRIAFVKYLFDGSQEDFNRVLSQLNSFKTEKEALDFINNFVKPDYNWSEKEEYESRLINLIERKFL
ncbi:hypothetical protein BX611_0711 [Lutibacter oceani]|uniref:Uncharacterized protein n=1 Tax=Lutibacter oceani TaxID=1853311 RepID=A0A3D9RTY1_9FLAO|nr:hypothetical protein [Lutibacter oceani]REE83420.1 hypothetical protein BX611_0711 [Lutibacter oceani]